VRIAAAGSTKSVIQLATILNIDTATATGSVALAKDGQVLSLRENTLERDHAAVLTLFIQDILREQNVLPAQLDAIAVSAGPGSYTGLRVGVATAKGLCYAWNKPLLGISTLQMMAQGMIAAQQDAHALYCPLLDARRQEVYTAVYDNNLQEHMTPQALILTADAFKQYLDEQKVYFFGDGSPKWQQMLPAHRHAVFVPYHISAAHLVPLSEAAFQQQRFADVAYFSPYYLKPFYTPAKMP
jgi:tRNA threonylcarbamoyladenosine biosynthesis protein TsaB